MTGVQKECEEVNFRDSANRVRENLSAILGKLFVFIVVEGSDAPMAWVCGTVKRGLGRRGCVWGLSLQLFKCQSVKTRRDRIWSGRDFAANVR